MVDNKECVELRGYPKYDKFERGIRYISRSQIFQTVETVNA